MIQKETTLNSIEQKLNASGNLTKALLSSTLPTGNSRLVEAMRYSTISSSKYIRSFYLTEIVKSLEIKESELLTLSSLAIEIIHTYSLIHDDLPAMDNDDMRRGKPTCHKEFDEATAILAGDSLLTFAFEILSSCKDHLDSVKQIKIVNIIAKAIGFEGMAGGQMLDIMFEKQKVSNSQIYLMQGMKTAQLFSACGQIAAVIADVNEERYNNIIKFSYAFGLCFQIIDDILDEVGDEIKIGKKINKDIEIGKARLVEAFGIEGAKQQASNLIQWGLKFVESEPNFCFYKNISNYIINRDH